jgi:hypothetical protein
VGRKETRTPAEIYPDIPWADWIRDHTATAVSYLQSASIHFQDVKARSYQALELSAEQSFWTSAVALATTRAN